MKSLLLLKVLLIEDNPSDVLLLRSALEEDQLSKFELTQADRLSDGIKLLDGGSFDIILADLGLPDSSGLETFERLHKHAPELPVIVFSGNDNEEQAIHAVREGAQDYLVKSLSGFEMAARSIRYGIERSKLQGILRDSEQRFSTLFRLNPVPVGITRQTDYSIVDVNDAWIELTGYTRDEAVGHTSAELGLVKPEKLKQIRKIIQEQGEINQFEVQLFRRSGEERHILISSEPIQLGSESYILNSLLDITERKRAEEALKESEARFSTAFFTNPVSQSILSIETGKTVEVNDACCRLYEFSRDELIGSDPGRLNLWANPSDELAAVDELQKTGHLLPKEVTIQTKSGKNRTILFTVEPIPWKSEPCLMTSSVDITDRILAEEKLRNSETQLRQVLDSTQDAIFAIDQDYHLLINNEAHQQVLTATGGHPLYPGDTVLSDSYPQETLRFWRSNYDRAFQGDIFSIELSWNDIEGHLHVYENTLSPMHDATGSITGALVVAREITEQKQAELALQEKLRLREQLEKTASTVPGMIHIFKQDSAGAFSMPYVSPAFRDIYGMEPEEVATDMSPAFARIDPQDVPHVQSTIAESAATMQPWRDEFRYHHPQKGLRWFEGHSSPVREPDGGILWYGIIQDITERKKADETLKAEQIRFTKVAATMPGSITMLCYRPNGELTFQYASKAFEDIFGLDPANLSENVEAIFQRIPPEHVQHMMKQMVELSATLQSSYLEFPYQHPLKGEIWLENRAEPVRETDGSVVWYGVTTDITDRKQAEQESAYRQELLEKVIQLGKNIASLTDLDTCLHEIYNSARFGLGYDRIGLFLYDAPLQHLLGVYGTSRTGEVEGPGFFDGPVSEFSHNWVRALQNPSGIAWIENYQEQHNPPKDHTMFGVGQHITVAAWAGEKPVALISADNLLSGREIKPADMEALQLFAGYVGLAIENASLQTELELKVQERTVELRDLYDNAPAGYHSLDINGNFIQVNLTELKWLGRTYDEVIGHHVNEFITEQSRLTFQQNFPRFIQDGVLSNIEIEMVRKDGSTFLALVNATAIKDGQGNFLMSRSTLYDHTERKHTEEALRASEARFNFLLSQTPAVIFTAAITEHAPITFISNSVSNVLGYTPEDYERNPTRWLDNIHPDDKPSLMPAIQAVMETGNAIWEVRTKCADGQYRWISNGITLIKGENGNPQEIIGYSVNIDETKRAQEALRENQENLQYFFDTASDLIQSMDENGNYLYVNAAWSQTLGYTSEEAKGLNMLQVVVPAYHEHCRSMLSSLVIDQHPQQLEVAFRTKQGHEVIVEGSVSSRKEPHGHIVTNGIFRNITERKRAEASMQRANIELERALRMKDEFLASMSHELRTPLTGILGLSEALQYDTYGELTPKQKSIVSNIESNGRHLLELINDILDISKMEAGKFDLNFAPCVLADICQASLQLVKGMAHKKNQNIAFSINPTDIIIQGDPRRLKQILVNLLSNAVKYSPEKSPIGLEVNANETEKIVKIEVWDKGMGISDDDIDRLFQPFVQLDSSLSRQQSGTGLGLALVKRLVDLHGGSIEVNSTPRQGSRFVVSLPYSSSPIELPEPKVEELPLVKNSLIVEDQTVDADRLNQFLKSLGIHSTVLTTGVDVLEKAAALQPGVILLDLNLPDVSGWEILKNLKRNEATRHIPVIVTSVQDEPEKARNFGADGSLVKLFTLNDLHQALIRLPRPEKIHPDQALVVSAEIHLGSIIVVDDNETNVLMVEDYLRSKNYHVYSYLNGDDFLANVEQVKPDLVLMDVQMPGMDGLEAIRRLRLLPQPEIASVPVIAITALAMPGDRERCLEAGANEYITKPVRLNKLVAMIQKILLKT